MTGSAIAPQWRVPGPAVRPPIVLWRGAARRGTEVAAGPAPCITGLGAHDTRKNGGSYPTIGLADIRRMVDTPQAVDKAHARWLIPSTLQSRRFDDQEQHGKFWYLWADIDENPPALERLAEAVRGIIGGACFECYTSRSATEDRPKARVLIPLSKPLSGADWVLYQQALNNRIEQAKITPDRAAERSAQLCYLPNRGAFYRAVFEREGDHFNPDTLTADVGAIRQRIESERLESERRRAEAKARREQRQSTGGASLVNAFNESFTVEEILLQAGYDQRGSTFRHPNSRSGSFSASVKDGRVHSLSSTDPLFTDGAGAHDPFSAFTVLFHGGDRDKALKDAGEQWLTIGVESWNKVRQREYMQAGTGAGSVLVGGSAESAPAGGGPLAIVSVAKQRGDDEPQQWAIPDVVPVGHVTLLGGHGGAGKSLLSLAWGVSVALGMPWGGLPITRRRVVFVSLEDDAVMVRRRLGRICAGMGVDRRELDGWLLLVDGSGADASLAVEGLPGAAHAVVATNAYRQLVEIAQGAGLVVIDNASDGFGGNENHRRQVRGFVRLLARMARDTGAAVLLLAHIDKAAAKGGAQGNSYSGSTAWHNSARSRLALVPDNGTVRLIHEKCNLGPLVPEIRLFWTDNGTLIPTGGEVTAAEVERSAQDQAEILAAIRSVIDLGDYVPCARTGPATAWHKLATYAGLPMWARDPKDKGRFWAAVSRLQDSGRIKIGEHQTSHRKSRACFVVPDCPKCGGEGCAWCYGEG